MAHNYFIACDLTHPSQNHDAVITRIKSLGLYAQVQFALFYVQSELAMADIRAVIHQVLAPNDRLSVVWAGSV
jgi:hypothetical protein